MTVGELIVALDKQPREAEVYAFTEFVHFYGDGVYVHIEKVETPPAMNGAVELGGACFLVEDFTP